MSAITVTYNLDKRPVEHAAMKNVLDSLKHRGDDAQGMWIDGNVGLGHRMRWVTPESLNEQLPIKSAESSAVITCDARIDNRDELIPQLSFSNKPIDEITDSEIILKAYEKWGKDCLPKLIGDFVFAIWNPKTRKIFCARDPLGVKHFYYYYEAHKIFALASEIKALFCLSGIPRELNEEFLGDYLILNFEDKESTFFKRIKRLPATHAMTVGEDDFRTWRYWQPEPKKEIRLRSHREYQEAFREKFTEAVTCRLRSAFPVGSMLSGGLDSSSIVCVASKYLAEQEKKPLHSYSAVFPTVKTFDKEIDELSYMKSVIEKSGCQAHFVNCDDSNPLKGMQKLMWHADHPVGAPNIYIDWKIFEAAAQDGIRVMLSGIDGDSTVSYGYEDFTRFAKRGQWIRLIREASLIGKTMPQRGHSFKNLAVDNGFMNIVPLNILSLYRRIRRREEKHKTEKKVDLPGWNILNSNFRKKNNLEERAEYHNKLNYPEKSTDIEEHWNGLTNGLMAFVLESYEKAAQAFSIEPRFPFHDRRLVEFCIALPPGQRIYNGWTRAIFRNAMNDILPADVQWRKTKARLGGGIKMNLLKYGSSEIEDVIGVNSWVLEDYINFDEINKMYQQYKGEPLKIKLELFHLISIIHLSKWLRETGLANNV